MRQLELKKNISLFINKKTMDYLVIYDFNDSKVYIFRRGVAFY